MKAAYWITSGALCAAGTALMIVGALMPANKSKNETFTKTFESAEILDIDLNRCTVELKAEDTNVFTVEFDDISGTPDAYIEGDTLHIRNKKRLEIVGFGWVRRSGTVTITVPAQEYENILLGLDAVKCSTMEGIRTRALNMDLDASTVEMEDVTVTEKKAVFDVDAGGITMESCTFKGTDMDMDASSLTVNGCTFDDVRIDMDAAAVHIRDTQFNGSLKAKFDASSGEFENCLLHKASFDIDAGDMDIDSCRLEGDLDLEVDAASIDVRINGKEEDYCIFSSNSMGSITVNGSHKFELYKDARYTIDVNCDAGSADIFFER